jgi:hypothetical protein
LRTEPKASRSEQLGVTPAHPAEGEHDEAEGERELLSVPTGLTDPATSVIVAEVTYSFTSRLIGSQPHVLHAAAQEHHNELALSARPWSPACGGMSRARQPALGGGPRDRIHRPPRL